MRPTQVPFPGAARDFSPRVNFQCRLSYGVHTPPCAIACIYIYEPIKDPVVHVRVWWIKETLTHPACRLDRLDSTTLSQLAFPREGNLNFPGEKSHWDYTVVKKKSKGYSECWYVQFPFLRLPNKQICADFVQMPVYFVFCVPYHPVGIGSHGQPRLLCLKKGSWNRVNLLPKLLNGS